MIDKKYPFRSFMHFRAFKPVSSVPEFSACGGMTVCFDLHRANPDEGFTENYMLYSFANCSKKDNYCREVGRNIAAERLDAHENVFRVDGIRTVAEARKWLGKHAVVKHGRSN